MSPVSTHPFHSPNWSSKRSIHSICGFLEPFCQLRMSNALLGCTVSPALGQYWVGSDTQHCSEMLCERFFVSRIMLLYPQSHRHQCLGCTTFFLLWSIYCFRPWAYIFVKAPRPNACPSDCLCLFSLALCFCFYLHAIHKTLCSPDLLIIWNR